MRTIQQRKADVLAALERNGDLWLATASRSGRPHAELEGRDVFADGRWLA